MSFNVPSDAGSGAKEIIKNIGYIYAAEPVSGAIRFFASQAPEYDISATVRGK